MLIALLAMIGLAPAQAVHDPCFGPSWAISAQTALVCDFKEASTAAVEGLARGYIGTRTGTKFDVVRLNGAIVKAVLVSERTVSRKEAQEAAVAIGENGGWVDAAGTAHGTANTWTLNLAPYVKASPSALVAILPQIKS